MSDDEASPPLAAYRHVGGRSFCRAPTLVSWASGRSSSTAVLQDGQRQSSDRESREQPELDVSRGSEGGDEATKAEQGLERYEQDEGPGPHRCEGGEQHKRRARQATTTVDGRDAGYRQDDELEQDDSPEQAWRTHRHGTALSWRATRGIIVP